MARVVVTASADADAAYILDDLATKAGANVAARNVCASFVNQRLCPRHIVLFVAAAVGNLGNAFIDQLPRRSFNRNEVAGCNVRLDPRFLFGCERYRHVFLYHVSKVAGERNRLAFGPA